MLLIIFWVFFVKLTGNNVEIQWIWNHQQKSQDVRVWIKGNPGRPQMWLAILIRSLLTAEDTWASQVTCPPPCRIKHFTFCWAVEKLAGYQRINQFHTWDMLHGCSFNTPHPHTPPLPKRQPNVRWKSSFTCIQNTKWLQTCRTSGRDLSFIACKQPECFNSIKWRWWVKASDLNK